MLPLLHRAGGYHIGVAGKAQHRAILAAVGGPEIVDVLEAHRLELEAHGAQAVHHLRLAVGVDGGDRGATDQVAGQLKGRRELGRGRHGGLRGKARRGNLRGVILYQMVSGGTAHSRARPLPQVLHSSECL
ncbi:hypothetical protein D3C81_1663660 [compost metagenome]